VSFTGQIVFIKTENGWQIYKGIENPTIKFSAIQRSAENAGKQADVSIKPEQAENLAGGLSQVIELKERIRLILQVMTDDALNVYLNQSAEQIAQELKSRNITFESSRKSPNEGDYSILVRNVGYDGANEAREYLQNFNSRFNLSSSIMDGNTNFTLTLKSGEVSSLRQSTVRLALETVRRRVDALGIAEPTLQIQGNREQEVEDRIIIEIPAVDDSDRITGLLSNTAQLELRLVKRDHGGPFSSVQSAISANGGRISNDYTVFTFRENSGAGSLQYMVVNRIPVITGKELKTAQAGMDSAGRPVVTFILAPDGAARLTRETKQHIGESLAIVLDNVVRGVLQINSSMKSEGNIQGNFTEQEAYDLALLLRSGALPASLQVLEQRRVSSR
jgi:preprotein translocase subunit SecD